MIAPSEIDVLMDNSNERVMESLQPWERDIVLGTSEGARDILLKMAKSQDKLGSLRSSIYELLNPIIEDMDDYHEAFQIANKTHRTLVEETQPDEETRKEALAREQYFSRKKRDAENKINRHLRDVKYYNLDDEITDALLQNADRGGLFNLSLRDQMEASNIFSDTYRDLNERSSIFIREELEGLHELEGFRQLQRDMQRRTLMRRRR